MFDLLIESRIQCNMKCSVFVIDKIVSRISPNFSCRMISQVM
jgi:hypothetical protein